jgi:lysophospholipid acyltransferase (LPLAT)-like uncharacterized protein
VHEATRFVNARIGLVLGLIARLWIWTLRLELHVDSRYDVCESRSLVFAFFHGTQFALLAWPRRRATTVMVSHSSDGEIQASAMRTNGLIVVRGSSSRGGARGLAALLRRLKTGFDAAFAVDGPRGPYGIAKSGALFAANRARGLVVPVGSAITRGFTLQNTWDKFTIPQPFSRVIVIVGAPLDPASTSTQDLQNAIRLANERARVAATASAQMPPRRSRPERPSASL